MYKMSWLLTCCLLMFLVQPQGALSQDDAEGGESSGCPPLKIKSVRITCTSADGEDQDCLQPETGTKARILWKKNVVQGSGTVTEVVCKENGSWKRSAGTKTGGGGGSSSSGGRKSGGDSDDDSGSLKRIKSKASKDY